MSKQPRWSVQILAEGDTLDDMESALAKALESLGTGDHLAESRSLTNGSYYSFDITDPEQEALEE